MADNLDEIEARECDAAELQAKPFDPPRSTSLHYKCTACGIDNWPSLKHDGLDHNCEWCGRTVKVKKKNAGN